MRLEQVFRELLDDLPWMDNVRLVVGPLASRESVKDQLLERTPIIPAQAAGTFLELATDILNKSKVSVDNSLSQASQCDALERVAATDFLRKAVPDLSGHLKTRTVSLKVSRFLSSLDRFYVTTSELDAIVEYCATRDANLGAFTRVIAELWRSGQLQPWGEGTALRRANELLSKEAPPPGLPRKIWLWGFFEFTPLEESLLQNLARHGVELKLLVPASQLEAFASRCAGVGAKAVALDEPLYQGRVWEPHSVWDELAFLHDELARLKAEGVRWGEIALFVPNDDLYKRFVRRKLHEWNVPLRDPTLSGAWKENAAWTWWRDLLRVLSGGLKSDDVRAWLAGRGSDPSKIKALFEQAFKDGVHGGAGQWAKLLSKVDFPELKLLVEGVKIFGRSMDANLFLSSCERFVLRSTELLGELPESGLLNEFARHLREERPYLMGFRARLPRFVPLFEEFLEAKSRTQSLRSSDGIDMIGHGLWCPRQYRHAFVLGSNTIVRARPGADLWDWESLEVRRIWDRLHFGLSLQERVERDEAFLGEGLTCASNVTFSAVDYDLSGSPLPRGAVYQKFKSDKKPERSGGSLKIGWATTAASGEKVAAPLIRAELVAEINQGKALRVSSFEDYLKCPFLYYARHVLGLQDEDELGLDPDGRARGTILHKVLERYLEEEISRNSMLSKEQGVTRLRELVTDELSKQSLTGMFRHRPLIEKAKAIILAHAEKWLDWELENRKQHPEVRPRAVEQALELSLDSGIKLRGKVDRVDSDGKHAVVIDYKTGSAPFVGRELQEGIGAQLLVYSRAIQQKEGLEPGAAYYLALGNKVKNTNGVFLKKHSKALHSAHARNSGLYDGEFGTLFERVSESWARAAESLKRGDFSPRPARPKKDCPPCSYRAVCGHDPDEQEGEPQ